MVLVSFIMAVLSYVYNSQIIGYISETKNLNTYFSDFRCVDDLTNILFEKSMQTLFNAKLFFDIAHVFLFVVFILHTVFIYFAFRFRFLKR